MNDIVKDYYSDIRNKKIAGSGIFSCKGKRGYVGIVRFPKNDFKRYEKNGKVVSYNMYDNIMSYEDYNLLSDEEKAKTLQGYRDRFPNKEIMKTWGVDHNIFYNEINRLGLPTQPKGGSKKKKTNNKNNTAVSNNALLETIRELEEKVKELEKQEQSVSAHTTVVPAREGLKISYTGEYHSDQLVSIMNKIGIIVDDENKEYDVNIFIQEKEKDKKLALVD